MESDDEDSDEENDLEYTDCMYNSKPLSVFDFDWETTRYKLLELNEICIQKNDG